MAPRLTFSVSARRTRADLRRSRGASRRRSLATIVLAALAAYGFYRPAPGGSALHRAAVADTGLFSLVEPAPLALGRSGNVRVAITMPGESVRYPLLIIGKPSVVAYEWIRLMDSVRVEAARPLTGPELVSPTEPGLYRLTLVQGTARRIVDEVTLAVLVPFESKRGNMLDGYRIGLFAAEQRKRDGTEPEPPAGFVKVTAAEAALPITKHLRLGDFLTRDGQQTWPRYAAVDSRLLDKVELVLEWIHGRDGGLDERKLALDVHSGFRTPFYNRSVRRAARDSRHQYGDAIDLHFDANGDGRITAKDIRLIAEAVEAVEQEHPDLTGGMGLYTGRAHAHPYVHIDARGTRVRWRA